ncbi:MAG: endonuclease III [Spirochaetia bacterium]|nr:endonuclease III [Spirochaetia bacterium]
MNEEYWDTIFDTIKTRVATFSTPLPSVSEVADSSNDPFRVLLATLISLRTRDEVTHSSSNRLFKVADTPQAIIATDSEILEQLIYPAGFYKTKVKNMKKISHILLEKYDGKVPHTKEELLALPGVGIKTANLTLNLGFNIDAICVDTHVHRISNRKGWIDTHTPEQSEVALQSVMPIKYWIPLNELLVLFGQQVCTPISPRCSICPFTDECKKIGVTTHR